LKGWADPLKADNRSNAENTEWFDKLDADMEAFCNPKPGNNTAPGPWTPTQIRLLTAAAMCAGFALMLAAVQWLWGS
jgi:hypothetical protein